jgi:hypothetical protein
MTCSSPSSTFLTQADTAQPHDDITEKFTTIYQQHPHVARNVIHG